MKPGDRSSGWEAMLPNFLVWEPRTTHAWREPGCLFCQSSTKLLPSEDCNPPYLKNFSPQGAHGPSPGALGAEKKTEGSTVCPPEGSVLTQCRRLTSCQPACACTFGIRGMNAASIGKTGQRATGICF